MRLAILTFLALAGMMLAACTVSTAPACPEGADQWVKYQLFMGRSNQTGEVVDDAAWATFLGDTVTPRFPDGLTVIRCAGPVARLGGPDQEGAHQGTCHLGAAG